MSVQLGRRRCAPERDRRPASRGGEVIEQIVDLQGLIWFADGASAVLPLNLISRWDSPLPRLADPLKRVRSLN
ncbi:hypothetical protein ABTY98_22970 [Streptomyces sp. NPDC096040]|uniref:hypothetical protein n=1 Tax=Streptomyces sp. NPDC096040 TaxID=3155541 RepID=UPI003322227D